MERDMIDKKTRKPYITKNRIIAFVIFLLCFWSFALALSYRFYGYEIANMIFFRHALYLGDFSFNTPAGPLAILSYIPFEWINLVFTNTQNYMLRDFILLHTPAFISALICLVFYLVALELFASVRTAAVLCLFLAFTTMIFPYSKMGMELQHTLWSLIAFWMITRWQKRKTVRSLVLVGVCASLILFTKIYGFVMTGIFMLYILIELKTEHKSDLRSFVRSAFIFLCPFVFVLILFLVHNRLRYGGLFLGNRYNLGYEAKKVPVWRPLFGFLFSSGKSIFIYNPPLLVSLFFFGAFFRKFPKLKTLFILVFALGLLFHSLLWIWTDETWGPRKLHYLIPFALLPLGCMIPRFGSLSLLKRFGIIFVFILAIFVQLLGVGFSYESHPVMLRTFGLSSLENLRYNPRLSHTVFNYSLLQSTIDTYITGKAHYLIYEPTYFATVLPEFPTKRIGIPLKHFSFFDFWFIENRSFNRGGFRISRGIRFYASFLLLAVPLLFFLLFFLLGKFPKPDGKPNDKSSGKALYLLLVIGVLLCVLYNWGYQKGKARLKQRTKDNYDIAVGNDPQDELILGGGWRVSEWMHDPKDANFEIPFRWTNRENSYLYFPCVPGNSYKLTLQTMFVYPSRISVWVNRNRIAYFKGVSYENLEPGFTVPASCIGNSRICEIVIQNHELHVPAEIDPENSADTSSLGIMVYGITWEKVEKEM